MLALETLHTALPRVWESTQVIEHALYGLWHPTLKRRTQLASHIRPQYKSLAISRQAEVHGMARTDTHPDEPSAIIVDFLRMYIESFIFESPKLFVIMENRRTFASIYWWMPTSSHPLPPHHDRYDMIQLQGDHRASTAGRAPYDARPIFTPAKMP